MSISSHVFSAHHPIHDDVIVKIAQSKAKIQQLSNEVHIREALPEWAVNPMIDFQQSSHWALMAVKAIQGQTLTDHLKAIALSQDHSEVHSGIDGWHHNVERQLTALHRAGYVHGDVKPSNIIIDQSGIGWLIDFGQSITIKTHYEQNPFHGGSRYFATKNVLDRKGKASSIDDYFGLAVSIACHLQGAHPFQELPLNMAVERHVTPNLEYLPARYARIIQKAYTSS
ncbi:serine/threonine protein kinase [Vibrio mexicanus]|uniref:serine/threonine protein kinase n=1 Tax=Vibrio mexicanus TaxID=1004326 RepID=UPI00063C2CA2|nr:serine/threonine-protein kinase [Vibrio mexicanus]